MGMGGHTCVVPERDWKYFGPAVNVAARIMAAGHCGQVLMSAVTAGLVGNTGLDGEHTLAGLVASERVYQVGQGPFLPL